MGSERTGTEVGANGNSPQVPGDPEVLLREWVARGNNDPGFLKALDAGLRAWATAEDSRWVVGVQDGEPFARPVANRAARKLDPNLLFDFGVEAAIDMFSIWVARAASDKRRLRNICVALFGLTVARDFRCEFGIDNDTPYARILEQGAENTTPKQVTTPKKP